MSLKDKINEDLISNMKAKNSFEVKVLRGVNAAIKQVEVDTKKEVSEEQVLSILQKLIKQRRESLKVFSENSRQDLADIESKELDLLLTYMPEQLTQEEIDIIVHKAIELHGATSIKDMGKVMGSIKNETAGKSDPAVVSATVKQLLSK